MKWYWILSIIVLAIIVGFWISRVRQNSEPIKANTDRIVSDLQAELDNINNWLSVRPNPSDDAYVTQKNLYITRKAEIENTLKTIFGCTQSISITKDINGKYVYTCINSDGSSSRIRNHNCPYGYHWSSILGNCTNSTYN